MKMLFGFAMLVAMTAVVAGDGVPTVVTYVPHDKVTSTMVKGGPDHQRPWTHRDRAASRRG
jgi:hypothetical protein